MCTASLPFYLEWWWDIKGKKGHVATSWCDLNMEWGTWLQGWHWSMDVVWVHPKYVLLHPHWQWQLPYPNPWLCWSVTAGSDSPGSEDVQNMGEFEHRSGVCRARWYHSVCWIFGEMWEACTGEREQGHVAMQLVPVSKHLQYRPSRRDAMATASCSEAPVMLSMPEAKLPPLKWRQKCFIISVTLNF